MPTSKTTQPFVKKSQLTIVYVLLAVILALCLYNSHRIGKSKIAFVDTAKVLKAYNGIEQLSASLEKRNKEFKSRLDTLAGEFQTAVKNYEKKRADMNAKEMEAEEANLRQKQEAYLQFNTSNQESLKKNEMKVIEKALERINDKIIRYAKNKGYSAVIGITPSNGVIYVDDPVNITEEIMDIINK